MVDLRSDTVTKPTEEMREAIYKAEVGDDVYGEDPTVNKLEEIAAEMLGKEAAILVTSGTQGNQIAVLSHTRPGDEIILEAQSHIFYYEAGAVAALSGVQTRTIKGENGQMPVNEIVRAIREENIHLPKTSLITLENTHNRGGGIVLPIEYMKKVHDAVGNKIPIHLDGARIFNASVALGVDVKEITQYIDTVQICLSKGLSAPIGSIIAGPKDWINTARKWRKRLGGGMRQAGIIAAPGIIALTKMVDRLSEDHKLAKQLAIGLADIEGISIDLDKVQTNIVIINVESLGVTANKLTALLKENNILTSVFDEYLIRLTTHREINESDIDYTLEKTREIVRRLNLNL
ncbi:MAG: low-specificity L-threonine aldolase [Vulcanibacillus sp.]